MRFSKEKLADWHAAARARITKTVQDDSLKQQRDKIIETNRFVRIVGAQWEGQTFSGTDLKERMDKYPRFEVNKILKEIRRISAEQRKNRINVQFKPEDPNTDQKLSGALNGAYRADYVESGGDLAVTCGFEDAITGGMGAIRICAEYIDELDPENENMRMRFKTVRDSASCVFFDPNAKEMDKSDAEWCVEIFGMNPQTFEDEYGRQGYSIETITSGQWQDPWRPAMVYVARYYEVRIERDEIVLFENPFIQEQVQYFASDIDEEIEEQLQIGEAFFEKARRKIKRRKVYCGTMDGQGWLDKPELIPFDYIPLVPIYGMYWFDDGMERIQGHATAAMDSQRLENLMVSMLADTATLGSEGTPIVPVEMLNDNFMKVWGNRNKQRPAFLPITAIRDNAGNPVAYSEAIGYTMPAQLNQGMVGLLQYTGSAIQELTGAMGSDSMPSNLAEDTVSALINRSDAHTGVYMDNLSFALKHLARVWLSGARNLYQGKQVPTQDEEGKDGFVELPQSFGNMKVVVDIGADFSTRRDQTVSKLTPIYQATPPDNPNHSIILSMIIDNLEGEGLDDLRQYNRRQLLLQGVVQPKDEQEQAMIEQAQQSEQRPDPNMLLAQAEMEKARVQEVKAQLDHNIEVARLELEAAKIQLEAQRVGAEVNLKNVQSLKLETEVYSNVQKESNGQNL